jgi:VWFA-related protein
MRCLAPVALAVLLSLLFAVANAQEPAPGEVIRIDSNLVSVPVIVSDRQNRYLPGLKVANFKLYDNTAEQKIVFFDAAEEPLNVALLLDTSRSTEGALKKIKEAARDFLKELRPQDRALIMTFDFAVHRLSSLTSDRKVLEKAVKQATVGEYFGTTLNDAVVEIIDKDFKPITGRKAIILLTDGEDAGSRLSAWELLDYAAEADAMIYSIYYESDPMRGPGNGRGRGPGRGGRRGRGGIFGPRFRGFLLTDAATGQFPQGRRDPNQRDRRGQRAERREERRLEAVEFLTKLSEETSGRFYQSDVSDLKQSFDSIVEELRYQYRLGFYPQVADGTIHTLKVRVDRPDAAVRSRRQYRTAPPK